MGKREEIIVTLLTASAIFQSKDEKKETIPGSKEWSTK
jgi:hypothetical protein